MVLPALSRHIDPRLVDFRKDVPAQDPSEETLVEFVILHGHNSSLESGIEQFSRQAFPFSLPKRHYGLNARVSADPLNPLSVLVDVDVSKDTHGNPALLHLDQGGCEGFLVSFPGGGARHELNANRCCLPLNQGEGKSAVSYTHLRAHETRHDLVC